MWRAFGMRSVICMCCLVEWAWLCLLSPAVRSPLSYTTARWGFESAWTRFAVICHCLGKVSEWEVTYDFILPVSEPFKVWLAVHPLHQFIFLVSTPAEAVLQDVFWVVFPWMMAPRWECYCQLSGKNYRHTHSDHVVYTIHQGVLTLKEVYTITTWINFVNPSYSSMLFF